MIGSQYTTIKNVKGTGLLINPLPISIKEEELTMWVQLPKRKPLEGRNLGSTGFSLQIDRLR